MDYGDGFVFTLAANDDDSHGIRLYSETSMTLSAAILSADDDDVVKAVVAVTVVLWSMVFVVADGGGDVDCGNGDCRVRGKTSEEERHS